MFRPVFPGGGTGGEIVVYDCSLVDRLQLERHYGRSIRKNIPFPSNYRPRRGAPCPQRGLRHNQAENGFGVFSV